MDRLLVTGVDFPLGSNMALALADRCQVLGVYRRQAVELTGVECVGCDLNDPAGSKALIVDWQPRWILHCGPLAAAAWDPAPDGGDACDEPQIAAHLAELASAMGSRLAVVSSDIVFSGPRMFHDESSAAANPLPWAVAVRNMERAVENTGALVVRTHAYGWSPTAAHAGFAETLFEALRTGAPVTASGRSYATPILATDLAELLWRAYEKRLHGLHHLAGAERASAFRFATELAIAMGFHAPALAPELTSTGLTGGHAETSLSSKRARRSLEMATPLVREGLARFAEQAQNGWRDRARVADHCSAQYVAAA